MAIAGLAAIVLAIIGILTIPSAQATNGFTGEQFLKWPREGQDGLLQNSITMTAFVASQGHEDIAVCINAWYAGDDAIEKIKHDEVLKSIAANPSYHPQAVLLAFLQKKCGSFKQGH